MLRKHSGYVGGLKEIPYREVLAKKPEFAFEEAVRRMLPSGVLGRQMLKKLKVYKVLSMNMQLKNQKYLN